jgi:hypothetical protein
MKIRDVRTVALRVPLPRAFEGGTYRITERATIMTEILTDGGPMGRMYSGDTGGDDQAKVRAIVEKELKPLVLGESIFAPERLWEKMFRYAATDQKRQAHLMEAISAVDIALWDAIGRPPAFRSIGCGEGIGMPCPSSLSPDTTRRERPWAGWRRRWPGCGARFSLSSSSPRMPRWSWAAMA